MTLVSLSFSHGQTPIEFRERIFFNPDAISNTCARFRSADTKPRQLIEYAILSTCNRTEFYALIDSDKVGSPNETANEFETDLLNFLIDARDVRHEELVRYGEWRYGTNVAEHLCRVSAGLESLVLGEPQILGQVGDALRLGVSVDSAGSVLTHLFQNAIRAGRRAREETEINGQSMTVPIVAVNMVEHELGTLEGKTVGLVGAGKMAELALVHLRKRGAANIFVVNRTIERAAELSKAHGGKPFVFEQLASVLADVDALISSTGAPHTLITKDLVASAMANRPDRKLAIADIALPRDVEPAVEQLPNVSRVDIDDLNMSVGSAESMRQDQVGLVEDIVGQELNKFLIWFRSIGTESVIGELRRKADQIRVEQLKQLPTAGLSAKEIENVELFTRSLVKKLFHDPTTQLRHHHGTRGAVDYAEAIRELFLLELETNQEQTSSKPAPAKTASTT